MNLNSKISQKVLSNTREKTKFLERNTENLQNELDSFKMFLENKKNNKMKKEGIWETGKSGSLMNYVKNLNNKEDIDMENIKKLRFLKHEERNIEKDLKNMKIEIEQEKNMMKKMIKNNVKKKTKGITRGHKCGQCEDHNATVSCTECVEDYCSSCFVAFHLKGALTKHRSRPIGLESIKTPRPDVYQRSRQSSVTTGYLENNVFPNEHSYNPNQFAGNNSNSEYLIKSILKKNKINKIQENEINANIGKNINENRKTSLFDGNFDEEKSAESFQQALAQWRNGKSSANRSACPTSPQKNCDLSETGTATQDSGKLDRPSSAMVEYNNHTFKPEEFKKFNIVFSKSQHSLSYIDQLYLKKFNNKQFGSLLINNESSKQAGTLNQLKKSHSDLEFRIDNLIKDIKTNGELAEMLIGDDNKNLISVQSNYQKDNELEKKIFEITKQQQSTENKNYQANNDLNSLETVYSQKSPKFSKTNFSNSETQKLEKKPFELKLQKSDNKKVNSNGQKYSNSMIKEKILKDERQISLNTINEPFREDHSKKLILQKQNEYAEDMSDKRKDSNVSMFSKNLKNLDEKGHSTKFCGEERDQVKRFSRKTVETVLQEENRVSINDTYKNNLNQDIFKNNVENDIFWDKKLSTKNHPSQNEEICQQSTVSEVERCQSRSEKTSENSRQKKSKNQVLDTSNENVSFSEFLSKKLSTENQTKINSFMKDQTEELFLNENKNTSRDVSINGFPLELTLCQPCTTLFSPKIDMEINSKKISLENMVSISGNSIQTENTFSHKIDSDHDPANESIKFSNDEKINHHENDINHENLNANTQDENGKIKNVENIVNDSTKNYNYWKRDEEINEKNSELNEKKLKGKETNNDSLKNDINISRYKFENLSLRLDADVNNNDDGDDDENSTTRSFFMRQSLLKRNFEKMEDQLTTFHDNSE